MCEKIFIWSASTDGLRSMPNTTFCDFVHFFTSREAGESWAAQYPGTFLLPIEEAYDLAQRKNQALYQDVLA